MENLQCERYLCDPLKAADLTTINIGPMENDPLNIFLISNTVLQQYKRRVNIYEHFVEIISVVENNKKYCRNV